jgi:O-antigen/teichoic acid export membrane protein
VCAALNVILDLTLIRGYGAVGAAVANGLTQFITGVGIWMMAIRTCGARFPFKSTGKLFIASAIMAAGVSTCSMTLPPIVALSVGVPFGVALFALSMRLLQPFDGRDRSRLMSLANVLPGPGARLYSAILGFVIPASQAEREEALATTV